jgi:hypothetical protein
MTALNFSENSILGPGAKEPSANFCESLPLSHAGEREASASAGMECSPQQPQSILIEHRSLFYWRVLTLGQRSVVYHSSPQSFQSR